MHSRNKLLRLLLRNYRAWKYGFTYRRIKSFEIPKRIWYKSQSYNVFFPNGYEKIFSEVLLDDEYFLDDISENISTIIDIGGNLGIFSIASRLHFPESNIIAFEPSNTVFGILERNSTVFNYRCVQKGIGSRKAKCKIIEGGSHGELTSIDESQNGNIEVIPLDSIYDSFKIQHIDLLKMDIEGNEYNVLSNTKRLSSISYITIEYHDSTPKDIVSFFNQLNFSPINLMEGPYGTGTILVKNNILS